MKLHSSGVHQYTWRQMPGIGSWYDAIRQEWASGQDRPVTMSYQVLAGNLCFG